MASNHVSNYDPPVMTIAMYPRRLNFMAKIELFKVPILSTILRYFGTFPVKRTQFDKTALTIALQLLKDGKMVGIFPQGTRIRKEQARQQVFRGASYLAAKSGSKVLPVGISGTEKIMPKGSFLPRPAKITVKIGKPLELKSQNKTAIADFSVKIMSEIYNL